MVVFNEQPNILKLIVIHSNVQLNDIYLQNKNKTTTNYQFQQI